MIISINQTIEMCLKLAVVFYRAVLSLYIISKYL